MLWYGGKQSYTNMSDFLAPQNTDMLPIPIYTRSYFVLQTSEDFNCWSVKNRGFEWNASYLGQYVDDHFADDFR